MLEQARASARPIDLHHCDGREALTKFGSDLIDLVMALRFFLNCGGRLLNSSLT